MMPAAAWAGSEIPIWSELFAAIMAVRFADELRVTPEVLARYDALTERPSVEELQQLVAATVGIDPAKATEDGRAFMFGTAAKLLSAMFFAPVEALSAQTPLPIAPGR